MDTLSCTAEPKLSMIRSEDNRHGITKSAEQCSIMTTINEEDRTLGLRIAKISISNPNTAIRTTRHPTDRLASTQIGTEIQTQIDNSNKTDQVILGPMEPTTASKHSVSSIMTRKF